MAKKTLRDEIEEAKRDAQYWRGKAEANQEAKNDLDKRNRDMMNGMASNMQETMSLSRNLLEIIRWMTNNETAKYPFNSEKDQRDKDNFNKPY